MIKGWRPIEAAVGSVTRCHCRWSVCIEQGSLARGALTQHRVNSGPASATLAHYSPGVGWLHVVTNSVPHANATRTVSLQKRRPNWWERPKVSTARRRAGVPSRGRCLLYPLPQGQDPIPRTDPSRLSCPGRTLSRQPWFADLWCTRAYWTALLIGLFQHGQICGEAQSEFQISN